MPRRSSSGYRGFGFGRSSGAPHRSAAASAPPRYSAPSQPGLMSGLGGVMLQGMAFGAGSEVAHQAVRGVLGANQGYAHTQGDHRNYGEAMRQDPCSAQNSDFMQCLQSNPDQITVCQDYLDLYKQCRQVQQ